MKLIPDLTVASGSFIGLKYAKIKSFGSTIAPKILGTYEAEFVLLNVISIVMMYLINGGKFIM